MYRFRNKKHDETCDSHRLLRILSGYRMLSVQHFVDAEHSVVLTVCSRYVTKSDVVTSLTSLRKDPKFKPSFRQLINLMQTIKLDLDFKDLVGIREVYDPFSIESRRAIAARPDGIGSALARMYQAIVDTDRIEVFPSRGDFVAGA